MAEKNYESILTDPATSRQYTIGGKIDDSKTHFVKDPENFKKYVDSVNNEIKLQEIRKQIEIMDQLLKKFPLTSDICVYRGLTQETAQRLMKENIFTNRGFSDVTYNILAICDALDAEKSEDWHNIMKILVPKGTPSLYIPEKELIVLPRDLSLKCVGTIGIESLTVRTPQGISYRKNVRLFAMVVRK